MDGAVIVGIGVDLVDIARFERVDRAHAACSTGCSPRANSVRMAALPLRSLAARFAAKEALIKALGDSDGRALARDARRLRRVGNPVVRS